MDKEIMIKNIERCSKAAGISPSRACIESGAGKSFISDLRRGQSPSVAKVADLAARLGVSTSDLIGDAPPAKPPDALAAAWAELNDEGREKLRDYAEDLVSSGRYQKKSDPSGMGQTDAG